MDSIAFACNISTHGVTGYTPFYLMHGWDPVLPFNISIPPLDNEYSGYHDWVEAAAKRLRCAHDEAYNRMTVSQIDRVKKNNPSNKTLKTSNSVYLWVPSLPRQAIKRITMRWHGPHKVISGRVGRNYEIATKHGKRLIHEQRVRKAWTDDDLQVAKEDDERFMERFKELLVDGGRVDTISGDIRNYSETMHSLLKKNPELQK